MIIKIHPYWVRKLREQTDAFVAYELDPTRDYEVHAIEQWEKALAVFMERCEVIRRELNEKQPESA